MIIPCPYCGERDAEEFSVLGEVAGPRPPVSETGQGDIAAFTAYVHERDNAFGPVREYWYHANGCRRWLRLTRDTRNHAILAAEFAP